jgi:ATP-binding cassette, subfamily B, bacterial
MSIATSVQPANSIWWLIRRFVPYLRPVRWQIALASGLSILGPLVSVALLWLMKVLIDDVLVAEHVALLPTIVSGYVLLIAAKLAMDFALTWNDAAITEQINQDVRVRLYRHLVSVSPGSLKKYSVGDLIAYLSDDTQYVAHLIYSYPMNIVLNIVSAAYFICFLLVLSWELTLCAVLTIPFLALLSWRLSPGVRRLARVARRKTTAWYSRAEERLGVVAVIQAFSAETVETNAFETLCAAARVAELRSVVLQARLTLVIEIVAAIGGLLVLVIGAREIHSGSLTVGALMAFLGSIGSLYSPITNLAGTSARLQRAAASVQRVVELLDTPSLVTERQDARSLAHVRGALAFADIRFSYPGGPEVLDGVSFKIEPGETVALVGPNGSGKSTLMQLALRLYDPTAGQVLIDGVDLRDVTLTSLRRSVAAVFQEPGVFRGSINDNIRYGQPGVSDEQFRMMAEAARVDTFADASPLGYATAIGPRGSWLSGGQRQRLALARALVRDAPVLLLDEAMAAIDSEAEELIRDAVERFHGKRTILLVSHRFSTVRRADRVVVLDNGRIVETGDPEVLRRDSGSRFHALFVGQHFVEKATA